jgi:hypothetical protein
VRLLSALSEGRAPLCQCLFSGSLHPLAATPIHRSTFLSQLLDEIWVHLRLACMRGSCVLGLLAGFIQFGLLAGFVEFMPPFGHVCKPSLTLTL